MMRGLLILDEYLYWQTEIPFFLDTIINAPILGSI